MKRSKMKKVEQKIFELLRQNKIGHAKAHY